MQAPRVDPVGVIEDPPTYARRARRHSPIARLAAATVLGIFVASSVGTTVYSLGVYCLTSFAGVPAAFSVLP